MKYQYFFAIMMGVLASVTNNALANDPIGVKPANLPTYAPKSNLSVWVGSHRGMEGAFEDTYLYSDGTACHMTGGVGAMVLLSGKWQYHANKTGIHIDINPNLKDKFYLNFNQRALDKNTLPRTLKLSDLFFYKHPVYLSFGNQTIPSQMVLFEYDKHSDEIAIPKQSRYLFVSSKTSHHQAHKIARFDLHAIHQNEVVLLSNNTLMGVTDEEMDNYLSDGRMYYTIKNGKVNNHQGDEFDSTYAVDLMIAQTDKSEIDAKKLYAYCSGHNDKFMIELLSGEINSPTSLITPTYLNWRGNISTTADWLKPRD